MRLLKTIYTFAAWSLFCFVISCHHPKKQIHRGFYYWKTNFRLTGEEERRLAGLQIQKLYLRFFDVNINLADEAVPAAKIIFNSVSLPPVEIIPVVFITNNTLKQTATDKIELLARDILDLINKTAAANKVNYQEIQLDCDWSLQTKEKFFTLLEKVKKEITPKKLSCTIRLHQIKYFRKTGLPAIDRGMLMFYNMGELADTSLNSIFNEADASKYTASVKNYPLPLDIALPVFCWVKQYRGNHIIGLLNNMKESDLADKGLFLSESDHQYRAVKDAFLHGEYIHQGDLLIAEEITPFLSKKAAALLAKNFSADNFTIVLYHWDQSNLSRYDNKDFEDIFHSFN